MTTNRFDNADDDAIRPTADPLRPDAIQCPCGAIADDSGECRKCRARARWDRRNGGRQRSVEQPLPRPGGTRPRSSRPRNRRPER